MSHFQVWFPKVRLIELGEVVLLSKHKNSLIQFGPNKTFDKSLSNSPIFWRMLYENSFFFIWDNNLFRRMCLWPSFLESAFYQWRSRHFLRKHRSAVMSTSGRIIHLSTSLDAQKERKKLNENTIPRNWFTHLELLTTILDPGLGAVIVQQNNS